MGLSFSSMRESKYLKKEDLDQDTGNLVTIKAYSRVDVSQEGEPPEYKYVVGFHEFDKPMVLNTTNQAILAQIFGDDAEASIGHQVVVYNDPNISFGGKIVGGIRIRAPRKAKPAPARQPAAAAHYDDRNPPPQTDEDVPF